MIAVIGANGNVGRSTVSELRKAGLPVRAILHKAANDSRLRDLGCEVVEADLQDSASLTKAITGAKAVQLILPLRPQTQDPAADLAHSGASLIETLRRTTPERTLLISDYGAHVATDIGLPTIFRTVEAAYRELDGHKMILRSAEHMHNWERVIAGAIASGILPTFQDPVDMPQPTIFAPDLGRIAAMLLMQIADAKGTVIVHAEGPRRYSANDVAAAISHLAGLPVSAQAIPRDQWGSALSKTPASLAELLGKANDAKNKGGLVDVEPNVGAVLHGQTELIDGLRPLVPAP